MIAFIGVDDIVNKRTCGANLRSSFLGELYIKSTKLIKYTLKLFVIYFIN